MADLDILLDRNDPAREYIENTENLVTQMATGTGDEEIPARRPTSWWKTPRFVVPAATGAALLMTAGAVFVPLQLAINGQSVDIDVVIPIHYTTETGVTVDCSYGIYVGDPLNRTPADQKLVDYLDAQDWSGIGDEIYDRAMANPYVPGPNDDLEFDTQEVRDRFSFMEALMVIHERVPADLIVDGMSTGSTMDCTGQLR